MAKAQDKTLNIVIPMAGAGRSFLNAGYSFPKPLIDINGKPMIQLVVENLKPKVKHKFIFICRKEDFDNYSLNSVFKNIAGENHEVIKLSKPTQGAACTVLTAIDSIDNSDDLIIANCDQVIDVDFNKFIGYAHESKPDGLIITFDSSHPKWSYARVNKKNLVLEVAEKKVISNIATVGLYYFKQGHEFVKSAFSMIEKGITFNNEFYVCPVYNEMILDDKIVEVWNIKSSQMHSMGTPEDLQRYVNFLESHTRSRKRASI